MMCGTYIIPVQQYLVRTFLTKHTRRAPRDRKECRASTVLEHPEHLYPAVLVIHTYIRVDDGGRAHTLTIRNMRECNQTTIEPV